MLRLALCCLLLPALAGCALGPGDPFATLESSLLARLELPEDRLLEDGWWKLSSNYELRLTLLEVQVAGAAVVGAAGEAGESAFDPANPPPGFSNCHGGHCHSDDGRLVPYDEVAASAGGGAEGGLRIPLSLPADTLDLLEGSFATLDCSDLCELPQGRLRLAELRLTYLRLEGTVRDGLSTPRITGEQALSIALVLPSEEVEGLASAPLEVGVDRGGPWRVDVALALTPTPALFDGIDFAAPAESLAVSAAREVSERLTRSLSAQATRSPSSN